METQSSTRLYDEIIHEVNNLLHNRYRHNAFDVINKERCDDLVVLHTKTLSHFGQDVLKEISVTLGYKVELEGSKDEICKTIAQHYMHRIQLLDKIFETLEYCKKVLAKTREGDVCYLQTNKKDLFEHKMDFNKYVERSMEIKDVYECKDSNLKKEMPWVDNPFWIDKGTLTQIKKDMRENKRYSGYAKSINSMDKDFYRHLVSIREYVKKIEDDIKNPLSKSQFDDMSNRIEKLLEETKEKVNIFYALSMEYITK